MQYKALKIACAVALLSIAARESLGESVGDERAVGDHQAEEKVEQSAEPENTAAAASIDHRETSGAVDRSPIKQGQKLTMRQKRLFVLGLGANEKN